MTRPETPWPATEGFESIAEPDPVWRPVAGKGCRSQGAGHRACGRPAVAEMNRGIHLPPRYTRTPSWWAYCDGHMYGRWIEDGQVMHWILRPIGEKS